MNLAHKIRMYPNKTQTQALLRACGVARFTYNYALAEWGKQYKAGNKPNILKLKKEFNAIKKEKFPWIYESPKDCNQQPFINLQKVFTQFFKTKKGYPKFKKKGVKDSFYISNDKAKVIGNKIKIPLIGKAISKFTPVEIENMGKYSIPTIDEAGNIKGTLLFT